MVVAERKLNIRCNLSVLTFSELPTVSGIPDERLGLCARYPAAEV